MSMANAFVCSLARGIFTGAVALGLTIGTQDSLSAQGAKQSGASRQGQSQHPGLRARPESVGVADSGSTWPGGVVYYEIENGSANLAAAINTSNADFTGVVEWEDNLTACGVNPCSATYVDINLTGTGGQGDVDTIGYPQQTGPVSLECNTDCTIATLLHEMGHIIGLYHEQTRTDSATYVNVYYNNVVKGTWPFDFQVNTQNQQLLTLYDYASVMQYPSYVDTRNGGPVIETIPAGIPLQGVEGLPGAGNQDYSAGDKEAILRLYGAAPTNITVTSNPVGLQVVVDGVTVTTPQTYSWALFSTHTLDVPDGVQTLTGNIENSTTSTTFYYTYGRWNDSTVQSHSITVWPGNGSPAFPQSKPQVATYSANFVQLVPYTESETPSGSGNVATSPAPQSYSGVSGEFFVARQQETLTATPTASYNFYEFNAQAPYFWLPGGLSANPKTFFVPDTGNPVAVSAEFTTFPVYTVSVNPAEAITNAFSDNLWAYIDGAFWRTPKNFSNDPAYSYDTVTSWAAGTTHTLSLSFTGDSTNPPEYPYSSNSRFAFASWNDAGAYSHTTSPIPATSTPYTANVTPQFMPATNFGFSPCGGSSPPASISPASGDGFYDWGTSLTFSATAGTGGWSFSGWNYDLTGTTNPDSLTADDETLVYANFGTGNSPLTLASLSPTSVVAGSAAFTLTLNGSGFDSRTLVSVNGSFLTPDVVNSSEIQVNVSASLVASPGNFEVYVEDFPSDWNGCAVFGYDTFTVTGTPVTPSITWNPASTIIYGSAGSNVLNASASAPGAFAYSATPSGGGSATDVTGGTTALGVDAYNVTATFTPTYPAYDTSNQSTKPLTVSGESVWIVNSGGGTSELAGNGYGITSSADPGAGLAVAIDHSGNVWTAGSGSTLLDEANQVGTVLNTPTGGGLNSPVAIAIDGNGQVWVANGNNSISLFSNAGAALSPSTGFSDLPLSTPSGVAVDLGGSVWITNKGNSSLTRILGVAAPTAPLATAAANNTTGARP